MSVKNCQKKLLVNAIGAYHIAKITGELNIKFVQISTDHFASPYQKARLENDDLVPINQYGLSKKFSEIYTLGFNKNALVIRTNFFGLGWKEKNFLSKIGRAHV